MAARSSDVKGRLSFVGLGEQDPPAVELRLVGPTGERKPLQLGKDASFSLDPKLVGKNYAVELVSPDLGEPRRFVYDDIFEQLRERPELRIPEGVWGKWHGLLTCVTGRVKVCRFRRPWLESISPVLRAGGLQPLLAEIKGSLEIASPLRICNPVCQGRVEVYVRTCCCPDITVLDPPIVIRNICEIIDCREILWPRPPWPDPGPLGPGPRPGPDPAPFKPVLRRELVSDSLDEADLQLHGSLAAVQEQVEGAVVRALQRVEAQEGGPEPVEILQLAGHLTALLPLSPLERVDYVKRFPELHFPLCTCSTTKVGEAVLQGDGHFDRCFFLGRARAGCTRRVLYRVSQFQGSGWVTIYDDFALGRTHALGEDPVLYASAWAQACEEDPHTYGPRPFALLERIGGTWADGLIHSTAQNGEKSFAGPLAAKDGLVNAKPSGTVAPDAGPYDQPWGRTLALYYRFHPGLEGLGARFYRTRAVRLSPAGAPVSGGETLITGSLQWRKYAPNPSPPPATIVPWVQLSHAPVNGVDGLYTIPFPDNAFPWLDGQFHAYVDTAGLPNGRYAFVLDLFDQNGRRLVPDSSAEAAAGPFDHTPALAFDFLRLDGPIDAPFSNTSVIPHKAAASLFLTDNIPSFGEIEQVVHTGAASAANCQYLKGPGTDTIAIRYSAYQSTGYQWFHKVDVKKGLFGPTTHLQPPDSANVNSGDTPPRTFTDLLGADAKCAFAATLWVGVRHTNGSGRLTEYDRDALSAFALESP